MGRRTNGCEPPFTPIQVGAWLYQLLTITWFAVVAFGFLSGSPIPVTITAVIWTVFLACAAGCWFWCQLADPSVLDTRCIVIRQHDAHYCAQCKKSVPGIDHHCKWLNTCVGTRTYFAFYMLTLFAALLYGFQIIALALLMSSWKSPLVDQKSLNVFGETTAGLYAVSGVGIALSAPPGGFYFLLFLLHTYLQIRGITTYEFLIERGTKQRKKREEKSKLKLSKASSKPKPDLKTSMASTKPTDGSAESTQKPAETLNDPTPIDNRDETSKDINMS